MRSGRNRRGMVCGAPEGMAGIGPDLHGDRQPRRRQRRRGERDVAEDRRRGSGFTVSGTWRSGRSVRQVPRSGAADASVDADSGRYGNGFSILRCRNGRGRVSGDHDGNAGSCLNPHSGSSRRRDRFHRVMRDEPDDRFGGFGIAAVGAWRSACPIQRDFRRGLVAAVDGADSERDGSGLSIWLGRDCQRRRESAGGACAPGSAAGNFASRAGETSRGAAG